MTEQEAIDCLMADKEYLMDYKVCDGEEMDIAISALEEIQQYRALETEIHDNYNSNVDIKTLIRYFIETIFKGERHEKFCVLTNDDAEEWEQYKALGTVEELREAMDKQISKKPIDVKGNVNGLIHKCPNCRADYNRFYEGKPYCMFCGQAIDWSEEE